MILIVDYGMGNLRSVQKAFERINVNAKISSAVDEILHADKLVLPGLGHFEKGINNLKERKQFDALHKAVIDNKVPILGICLGMQLMTGFSEEGNVPGLGWINAKTKRFSFSDHAVKIPHMGWNNLEIISEHPLFKHLNSSNFFYFVHSYYVLCENSIDILAETSYNISFVSSFSRNNIHGCQFHPEKSHTAGLTVLKNFTEIE